MDIDPAPSEAEHGSTSGAAAEPATPTGTRRRTRRRRSRTRSGRPDPLNASSNGSTTDVRAEAPTTTHVLADAPTIEHSSSARGSEGVAALSRSSPAPDKADGRVATHPTARQDPPEPTREQAAASEDVPEAAPLPPLPLRDGLPPLVETAEALQATIASVDHGSGPLAIDTERASGYRYGQRAYLIQIRRAGSGTHLVDPIAVPGVPGLAEALTGPQWILHAATQDLPCLLELGLTPSALFDTELAGRLLGMPRVGLAAMVADLLGHSLAKGHGAADWSRRPLPEDWLEYAALDVEVLLELREELVSRLEAAGKLAWALEEFEAIRTAAPPEPRVDPWRRTAGIHQVRSRRGLAMIQQLWTARDEIAREIDIAPGRLLPDSSIIAAGRALPRDITALRGLRTFHGRGATRYQREWGHALEATWAMPEAELPKSAPRGEGAPPARVWPQRDPMAAARLDRGRKALARRAEQLALPVENLVTPDLVRRLMWDPEAATSDDLTPEGVALFLRARGARTWQVEQVSELLAQAIPVPG